MRNWSNISRVSRVTRLAQRLFLSATRDARRQGFAILTVTFIMVIFSILGIAAVSLVTGSSVMMGDEYLSARAFDVAEAGLEYMAGVLKDDTNWQDNTGVTKTFGPGQFTTTFLAQTATTATIRSDGTVGGITRSMTEQFTAETGFDAFKHALYTEQDISVGGTASGTVTGDSAARSAIDTGGGVAFNGEVDANDPTVDAPTPNWAYWQGVATNSIVGNYTFNAGTYTGIYYITGDVTFKSDITINGTIVALGKVTANNTANITIASAAPNPAIVAGDTVTFTGALDTSITGYVFSMESIRFLGNSEISAIGGFAAVGSIDLSGTTSASVTHDDDYSPTSGFDGGKPSVGVNFGLWQETS